MTRGYIGVVIALDTFTKKAQEKIKDDKLPSISIKDQGNSSTRNKSFNLRIEPKRGNTSYLE